TFRPAVIRDIKIPPDGMIQDQFTVAYVAHRNFTNRHFDAISENLNIFQSVRLSRGHLKIENVARALGRFASENPSEYKLRELSGFRLRVSGQLDKPDTAYPRSVKLGSKLSKIRRRLLDRCGKRSGKRFNQLSANLIVPIGPG